MTPSSSAVSASDPGGRLPRWMRDWAREQPRHVWLTDLVVGLVVMATVGVPVSIHADWSLAFDWAVLASWVPATIGLCLRRVAPWPAMLLVTLGFNVKLLLGVGPHFSDVAMLVVLYSLAANGSRLLMWLSGAAAVVLPLVQSVYLSLFPVDLPFLDQYAGNGFYGTGVFLLTALIFALPLTLISMIVWLAGVVQRVQITAGRLSHSAELAELEYQRTQEQLFVEQERNRIARDIHDVIAHSLAVVVAQADGGRYLMKVDPKKAEPVLETISDTAREALGDVRNLLGQLRHTQGEGPQKALCDIPGMVERIGAAGLRVDFEELGEPQHIGAIAELAVYRLVQEALTNALKYSEPNRTTSLRMEWGPDRLRIRARNRIAEQPRINAGSGHGLTGMRERLLAVGGETYAGAEGADWVVGAEVPYIAPGAEAAQEEAAASGSEAEDGAAAANSGEGGPIVEPNPAPNAPDREVRPK